MTIFIAHPISNKVKANLESVRQIYRQLALEGKVKPIAPYYLACHALDDNIESERAAGIRINKTIFKSGLIDEVWLYGDFVSKGMEEEIKLAQRLKIPVVVKSDKIAERF